MKWFLIASNDIRRFLGDRSGYVWLFLMPTVFTLFFANAFKGDDSLPVNPKPWVLIDNQDEGFFGNLLMTLLDEKGLHIVLPESEDAATVKRGIRISADFSKHIQATKPVEVTFFKVSDGSERSHQMMEVRLFRSLLAMTSHLIELDTIQQSGPPFDEPSIRELMARNKIVEVAASFAGRSEPPSGFQQYLPGILVMFLLTNLIIFGGSSIAEERRDGVFRRIVIYPISHLNLVIGKIFGRFLLAMVQILFFAILGQFFFGVDLTANPIPLLVVLAVYSWGCAGLGVLIGALVTQPEKTVGLGILVGNMLAALGGCWWPIEVAPEFMQQLAACLPTGWAMAALHQVLNFGGGWSEIAMPLSLLAGLGTVITLFAGKLLRY